MDMDVSAEVEQSYKKKQKTSTTKKKTMTDATYSRKMVSTERSHSLHIMNHFWLERTRFN